MTTIRDFIRKYPVMSYFALTFALSWGAILILVGPGGFLGSKERADVMEPLLYVAMLAGPAVAGVLMTGLVNGRAGFGELRARLFRWQVDARWYLVALLTAPISMAGVLFALSLLSPVFLPGIVTTDDKASLLMTGLIVGLLVGLFEELGWTGFAVPKLRLRGGIVTTGLIVGLVWGAWHFPLFVESANSSESLPPALSLSILLFSFLPPFRVLLVWLYDRTGSLLVVILMHATLTASTLIFMPTATGSHALIYDLVWAAVLWIFVAAVTMKKQQRTLGGRPPKEPLPQHG